MSRKATITLVQFKLKEGMKTPTEHLHVLQDFVRTHRESDLIIFPELSFYRHALTHEHPNRMRAAHRGVSEEEIRLFGEFVADNNARVVYGELLEQDGKLYNVATYTDGRSRLSYAKTHVHWSESFERGSEFPVIETPLGPTGLIICFDAAFPEVPRILTLRGAKSIVNVSAIPDHFPLKHVHRRLVACSVYNQVYTFFANRTGAGFLGGSAVVDPYGDIIALADDKQNTLTVDVDLSLVDEWRMREPLFANRLPHLYDDLSKT